MLSNIPFRSLTTDLLVLGGAKYIVNLEDHAAELGRKHDLLLLPDQRLEHTLLLHV